MRKEENGGTSGKGTKDRERVNGEKTALHEFPLILEG